MRRNLARGAKHCHTYENKTAMEREPLVCKVLRKFLPRLAHTLDPSIIATGLYSADIIDDRVWEDARKEAHGANYDRCLNLLEALIRSLRASPDCFDKFCAILEDQEVTKVLAAQLREELKKMEREATKGPLVNKDMNRAEKRKSEGESEVAKKLQRIIKPGPITDDKLFNDMAMDISDKYEEVGLELGVPYKVLRSELESGPFMMMQGHKKATRMLHLWREAQNEDSCTYKVLAAALEKRGLQRCAQTYCYTTANTTEQ